MISPQYNWTTKWSEMCIDEYGTIFYNTKYELVRSLLYLSFPFENTHTRALTQRCSLTHPTYEGAHTHASVE